ncbi:acetyltransferase [Trichoderma cornu-damae]|uniref:Acetyltransferase n=1 Tax=Trichoderma cornu-damae TaxID=654480 RepID=A0A9P8QUC7_9HYPO|nr:acetyltransferase [Trichoderma cornu-damae]
MPQPLAPKEAAQFRTIIRSFEDKQYKRGLKTAELILKKHPRHGDTMAMKALILNSQGKSEEAFPLAKEALTVDMKSHICWHVYGLLYRSVKNFEEAIKAYKFALKLDPSSAQIQRDLAILQVHVRDYQGYVQSRTAMLQARPQARSSWTALAIAHHLAGNLAEAENVLGTYEGTLKSTPSRYDFEHSEAVMYKNSIIAEQGDYQRALDHLDGAAKHNLDRLAAMECRAGYLLKLGRKEDAVKAYRLLIDRNSEHIDYYEKLEQALELSPDDVAARKAIYDEYAAQFPRCDIARRIPLDFLTGDEFREAAEAYLTLMLTKGVPSLFANLKHLYSDSFKKDTLREIAENYLASQDVDSESKDKGEAAALYYLAQHYNYHMSRDLAKAKEYVDRAIEKDAKSVDFHMTKARISKHEGNIKEAAETMNKARKLDLKDRYINSKCAKYQLRNGDNDQALKTIGLFTRAETVGGPIADLVEMQCVWFLTEDGEAYARQGNVGLALKRFHALNNIFEIWQDDQFDFHNFSLRKGQIRAYVDMVRWEDHFRDHPVYTRVALDAVNLYLKLADKPPTNGTNGADAEDALEKKKAAKKARKEQQRLEREEAERHAKQDPNKGGSSQAGDAKKKDEDPLGLALAATTDPLGQAMKFLGPMLQLSPKSIEAQIAGFEVHMRRRKYVLALQCLNRSLDIDAENPRVHEQVVAFRKLLDNVPSDLPPKVVETLKAEFKAVDDTADLSKYNQDFQAKHQASPLHVLSAIKARLALGVELTKCEKEVVDLVEHASASFTDAVAALETLKSWRSAETDAFRKAALAKWPNVTGLSE